MSQLATPIADAVTARLQTLQPSVYQLENESMRHASYFEGKETHFKLTLVIFESSFFEEGEVVTR